MTAAAEQLDEPEVPPARESGPRRLPLLPTIAERHNRRKRAVKARTVGIRAFTKEDLELGRQLYPEAIEGRPRTRGECADVPRPCPYVACKYHLFLDVTEAGSIKLNFPEIEPGDLAESCALDVADRGGASLEEVGAAMNLVRERIRQVEVMAMESVSAVLAPFADRVVMTRPRIDRRATAVARAQHRVQLLLGLLTNGGRTCSEIATAMTWSANWTATVLSNLAKDGRVVRLRRGVYALPQEV